MGDERFAEFARSRGPGLLRLAYAVTGDRREAEDVVQAALARAYASWRSVERATDPDAYVRRIVVNAAADGRRWRARRVPETLWPPSLDPAAVGQPAEDVAAADLVRRLLADLPRRQRAVVALRFLDDLSEQATADALGISVGAVKSHTSRALATLRVLAADTEGVERG